MRIVVAEDSAVVRAGLVEILADRGYEVVAAVGDADALRAAVAEHEPDVAVVDVRMPPGHTDEGLRAAIAIRRDRPGLPILVFSQYVETRYAADLLGMRSGSGSAGAAGVGYLLKDRSNSGIADRLVVSERAVEKHVGNIFSKLGLPVSDADHRRVLAVLAYLES